MNRFIAIFCAVFFLAAPAFAVDNVESDFAGVLSCKKCHRKVFRSWKKSKMAMSYEILKPGQRAEIKKKAGLDPQRITLKTKHASLATLQVGVKKGVSPVLRRHPIWLA